MKVFFRIFLLLLIFSVSLRLLEQRIIYFPLRPIENTPALLNLDYREVYFETADAKKLNAWFIPHKEAFFTVLFSNGNAANMSYRLDKILLLHQLGANVFIYDYRGYGKSQGRPSEKGLYKDIRGAYNYLIDELGILPDEIILYGESLGGALAIDLAYEREVRALISEGTFASVKEMAPTLLFFIPYFIFSSRFDSLAKIGEIECKKLIIHSKDDEIIPFSHGKSLFEKANPPKKFLKLRGGHNTAFLDSAKEYRQGLKSFLSKL